MRRRDDQNQQLLRPKRVLKKRTVAMARGLSSSEQRPRGVSGGGERLREGNAGNVPRGPCTLALCVNFHARPALFVTCLRKRENIGTEISRS